MNKLSTNRMRKTAAPIYLVGGAVRDKVMGRVPHDLDYAVTGITPEEFLRTHPGAQRTGKDFPVFRWNGDEYAMARGEKKIGVGHNGFEMFTNPDITIEQDLARRDLTMNAMAQDPKTGRIIDPFGGQGDIAKRVIRHTSPAFAEDPLRVLRAARFSSTMGYDIAPETMELMRKLAPEVAQMTPERVFQETQKALASKDPRRYFDALRRSGSLGDWFSPVNGLIGVRQPAMHHPEGGAYEHTMRMLGGSGDPVKEYAKLNHDLGKGTTPRELWPKHYGHGARGVPLSQDMSKKLKVPNSYRDAGVSAAKYHTKGTQITKPNKLIDFATETKKTWPSIREVISRDAMTPLNKTRAADAIKRIESAMDVVKRIGGKDVLSAFPGASGKQIGSLLRQLRIDELKRILPRL